VVQDYTEVAVGCWVRRVLPLFH